MHINTSGVPATLPLNPQSLINCQDFLMRKIIIVPETNVLNSLYDQEREFHLQQACCLICKLNVIFFFPEEAVG
ncbi:hypothetical protein AV530_016853 [Patagioenas fasciata monilis]|uniref:Uncharacterized protein n=1 Tax=Patagioenas fasciata monilis TaxID=372326 RepID=A0A1V4J4H5_PATFA|nr:hypothetical protein AV530_016853 [Patagioenas fasciata monilis]